MKTKNWKTRSNLQKLKCTKEKARKRNATTESGIEANNVRKVFFLCWLSQESKGGGHMGENTPN
jgi:hypothetical protein